MAEQKHSAAKLFAATAEFCLQQHKEGNMTTAAAVKILNASMRKCAVIGAESAVQLLTMKPPKVTGQGSAMLAALNRPPRRPKPTSRKPRK